VILTGKEIIKQIDLGNITIDPFVSDHVNPNSINYRLGDVYTIAPNEFNESNFPNCEGVHKLIPDEGLMLKPGIIYLATTYENIGSNKFVPLLIGRSSVGRLGLFVQISADMGNLGPSHKWTLELTCIQPVIVYPRMKIGQVSFWVPYGSISEYTGPYTDYDLPQHCIVSRLYKRIIL
jgi:dCTP deaminase